MDYVDRFVKLAGMGRREKPANGKDLTTQSDASLLAGTLHEWVSRNECTTTFIPHLDNRIETAEAERRLNIESHALAALWEGYSLALKELRADMIKWRGTVSDAPHGGR